MCVCVHVRSFSSKNEKNPRVLVATTCLRIYVVIGYELVQNSYKFPKHNDERFLTAREGERLQNKTFTADVEEDRNRESVVPLNQSCSILN